jgi:hypothetical protein
MAIGTASAAAAIRTPPTARQEKARACSGCDRRPAPRSIQLDWNSAATRSAVEHRPTDLVPQALVVEYEVVDCLWKLVALPQALQTPCAVAVAFGCGSACGLDRIGGRSQLVRSDVRDDRGLTGGVCGMPRCPRRSLAAACARPAALRACVIMTSPRTQARACSIA